MSPDSYREGEDLEDDGIPFEEKMESFKAKLLEQFEKGEGLKQILIKYFKIKEWFCIKSSLVHFSESFTICENPAKMNREVMAATN